MLGLGLNFWCAARAAGGTPQIITADTAPTMAALTDAQTPADGYTAGTYSSTAAGGTATVSVAEYVYLNGVQQSEGVFNQDLDPDDTVQVRVVATDSEGNVQPFNTATVTVGYAAPVAAGGLSDLSLTLDEAMTPVDVSSDFTGQGLTFALAPSSGALASGIALSSVGVLSGEPTEEVTDRSIVIRGTNPEGEFADSAFSLTVVADVSAADFTLISQTIGAPAAPMHVAFDVDSLSDFGGAELRDVTVEWDYDDDYAFENVSADSVNDARSGTSLGHLDGHTFPNPGTYTVTCRIRHTNGADVSKTVEVVVPDPDVVYSGSNTICVSHDGDFTGAPAGCVQIDWSGGVDFTGVFVSGKRTLFKAGMDLTINGFTINGFSNGHILAGRFGTGNDPLLRDDGLGNAQDAFVKFLSAGGKFTFTHVNFLGVYDQTATNDWMNESTAPAAPNNGIECGTSGVGSLSLHLFRCHVNKFNINLRGGLVPIAAVDCNLDEWHGFGYFLESLGEMNRVIGTSVLPHPNAVLGLQRNLADRGWNVAGWNNDTIHSCMRIPHAGNFAAKKGAYISLTGWSEGNSADGLAAVQPCMRIGTARNLTGVENVSVALNTMKGGVYVLTASQHSGGEAEEGAADYQGVPKAFVVESNLLIGDERSEYIFNTCKPGFVERNNITRFTFDPSLVSLDRGYLRWVDPGGSGFEPDVTFQALKSYNSTLIMDTPGLETFTTDTETLGVAIEYSNNLWQINEQPGHGITDSVFTRTEWGPLADDYSPDPGSPARGAVISTDAVLDAFMQERWTLKSTGALRPDLEPLGGDWSITFDEDTGAFTILDAPFFPLTPPWFIETENGGINILSYPGEE